MFGCRLWGPEQIAFTGRNPFECIRSRSPAVTHSSVSGVTELGMENGADTTTLPLISAWTSTSAVTAPSSSIGQAQSTLGHAQVDSHSAQNRFSHMKKSAEEAAKAASAACMSRCRPPVATATAGVATASRSGSDDNITEEDDVERVPHRAWNETAGVRGKLPLFVSMF